MLQLYFIRFPENSAPFRKTLVMQLLADVRHEQNNRIHNQNLLLPLKRESTIKLIAHNLTDIACSERGFELSRSATDNGKHTSLFFSKKKAGCFYSKSHIGFTQ